MLNQNTNNGPRLEDIHAGLIQTLRDLLGKKNLKKIYTYRERKRKTMMGLRDAYEGHDRSEVFAASKLWLSLLDHTLWQLTDQAKIYFAMNPHCYKHKIVGLCLEWHDFDCFLEMINKVPGYQLWVDEMIEGRKGLAECDLYLRDDPRTSDLLLRPTNVLFVDESAVDVSVY